MVKRGHQHAARGRGAGVGREPVVGGRRNRGRGEKGGGKFNDGKRGKVVDRGKFRYRGRRSRTRQEKGLETL